MDDGHKKIEDQSHPDDAYDDFPHGSKPPARPGETQTEGEKADWDNDINKIQHRLTSRGRYDPPFPF
jgi:hypothetical protein